ncbi:hypothetical protein QUB80_26995 [Chlorogloeopsis sp. ULAP01]|uniref:hypothetical protein n=1 Tax=Chlorogloeopsis sp. ULAP01 TaxID=3056483 RepID=UPI0025AB045F|nr:hypothetical protein [Chlorogloeopsis sp. ULAP01]MDM9384325.1 hypothetical protein [Chlorogloeopsis sp. ULAP01]
MRISSKTATKSANLGYLNNGFKLQLIFEALINSIISPPDGAVNPDQAQVAIAHH